MNYASPIALTVLVHNAAELRAVYRVLAGTGADVSAVKEGEKLPQAGQAVAVKGNEAEYYADGGSPEQRLAEQTKPDTGIASGDPNEVDSDGHPWSADLHASTRTKTGDGKWRMKVGQKRPDPMPGFPKDGGTGTSSSGASASDAKDTAATSPAVDEDDEFAAFSAAANRETPAASSARSWSDTDLSKLNNQAAQKLGGGEKIKPLIAKYVPQGEVQHSRNIPADKREDYAKEVESVAGIEYEG